MERKMATVRKVKNVVDADNSDNLSVVTVDGWRVVAKKGDFREGDLVVYCEVDSWVPYEVAPFLSKGKEPKVYNGVRGEKLRTVKLRGNLSQGLLLPMDVLPSGVPTFEVYSEGYDVSELLNVQKWEAPVPATLSGVVRGNFPNFLVKTDEERVQNLNHVHYVGDTYTVTEKLDGSSVTVYKHNGVFGVCSRNLDLQETQGNTFWDTVRSLGVEEKLSQYDNVALQGELIGPGVQGNNYKLLKHSVRWFKVYDVTQQSFYSSHDAFNFVSNVGLQFVPVKNFNYVVQNLSEELQLADGESHLTPGVLREGYVYRSNSRPNVSFKVVSNAWLLQTVEQKTLIKFVSDETLTHKNKN